MPIADFRVGDEIETAWTFHLQNPVLGNRSENRQPVMSGPTFGRLFTRFSWPKGRAVKLRVGKALPKGTSLRSPSDEGLVIDETKYTTPQLPAGAPIRFLADNVIDLSEFSDWAAVAETMRPLYDQASLIAADSPIQAEIRRIAAISNDPAVRATQALKTVQGQVRYFASVDGLGGYKPETAESRVGGSRW